MAHPKRASYEMQCGTFAPLITHGSLLHFFISEPPSFSLNPVACPCALDKKDFCFHRHQTRCHVGHRSRFLHTHISISPRKLNTMSFTFIRRVIADRMKGLGNAIAAQAQVFHQSHRSRNWCEAGTVLVRSCGEHAVAMCIEFAASVRSCASKIVANGTQHGAMSSVCGCFVFCWAFLEPCGRRLCMYLTWYGYLWHMTSQFSHLNTSTRDSRHQRIWLLLMFVFVVTCPHVMRGQHWNSFMRMWHCSAVESKNFQKPQPESREWSVMERWMRAWKTKYSSSGALLITSFSVHIQVQRMICIAVETGIETAVHNVSWSILAYAPILWRFCAFTYAYGALHVKSIDSTEDASNQP